MTKGQYLRKLHSSGLLKAGMQLGIISIKYAEQLQIYDFIEGLIQKGETWNGACIEAEIKFNKNYHTCKRIYETLRK